jgi:CheY-like chemotaxis protein
MKGEDEDEKGLRILLAEDNVTNRMVAAAMLENRDHTPVKAANGHEAV